MRILITGAAGMLGLDVQAAVAANGDEAIALPRRDLDITDTAAVTAALSRARPDVVINCAAYTKVDNAEGDLDAARAINADGPGILAAAVTAAGAWIVHVSTDYVFDGTKDSGPYVESDPTGPRSVYGITKLEGEQALAAAAPDSHTIVRSSWLFGTGGPCFAATILRVAATRPEMRVVDDQVGSPTYTPHLAAALVELGTRREVVGVSHVAAAGETTWFGFASALVAAAQVRGTGAAGERPAADGAGMGVGSQSSSVGAASADGGAWATLTPCTTAEYPLPAPRPAYSLLRTEREGEGVPVLADWREGLAEYMTARGDL